jgi:DNA-binding HxlR family transcriptional regulator
MHERASLDLSECPIGLSIDIVGQKWTLLIVREALNGVQRFSDFEAVLHCPRNLLAARLRMLCDNGILRTARYVTPGERVREFYELTDAGRELAPTLIALFDWGAKHRGADGSQPPAPRCRCGSQVHTVMVCDEGHVVDDVSVMMLPERGGLPAPGASAVPC